MNKSSELNISFKVYVYDPKTNIWLYYGVETLRKLNDTAFIRSGLEGKLRNYRYFAIESMDNRDFKYEITKTRNDLYIYVFQATIKHHYIKDRCFE